MGSEVTLKGGSSLTELALAIRERSLSGSGWKVQYDEFPAKEGMFSDVL
jgi:hypothetical protein